MKILGRKKSKIPSLSQFEQSAWLNNMTFIQYQDRLTELAISMFEWKGLPDTIDPRYIELELFMNGSALYFNDEVIGNLCLSMISHGQIGYYGEPIKRRAYSKYNNFQMETTEKNSVIIWNNHLRTNSVLDVQMFAFRLYNCDRIIDVNLNAQKTPVMVTATEQQKLTMLNLYKEYDGNQPFIFADKGLNLDSIKVLKTEAPFIADKIHAEKVEIWNEALTYLGIPNTNYQKKARLITDEVNRGQGGTLACLNSRLKTRQLAAEKINKMFGTDISVDMAETITTYEEEITSTPEEGKRLHIEKGGSEIE